MARPMTQKELQQVIFENQMANLEETLWWTLDDEKLEGIKQSVINDRRLNQLPVAVIEAVQRRRAAA